MCIKTVIKPALKSLPKSIELQKALEADETVKKYTPDTEDMFEVVPDPIVVSDDEPVIGEGGEIIDTKSEGKKVIKSETKKTVKKEEIEPAEVVSDDIQKEAEELDRLI